MGQRSATDTLFGIVAAFIERRTWSQADLARRLDTRPETVRKYLGQLKTGGFPLDRKEEPPQVYWTVPRTWMPGALAFKAEEASDLLRLISRAPRGALRDRVLKTALDRLPNLGRTGADFDPTAVRPPQVTPEEEKWLDLLEDAAGKRIAIKMRYVSTSSRRDTWRHASVHRVDAGARPQFVATCHRTGELRRFRVGNIVDARLDRAEPLRAATPAELDRFDRESFAGFHEVGPAVRCAFFVRDPEAAWVVKNLPDENVEQTHLDGGVRFELETTGVLVLARFVAGLGEVARPETNELAAEVARIAAAALANANAALSGSRSKGDC